MSIDEMPAGRDMDVLVAEKVMQLKAVHHNNVIGSLTYDLQPGVKRILPHYSTDIAAAWQVVEKLRSLRLQNNRRIHSVDVNYLGICTVVKINSRFQTIANTAPLAICLAALKATDGSESS